VLSLAPVLRFLIVCLGGAIGTGARYLLATWVTNAFGADFPRGTILINMTGSFLIAVVMELAAATGALSVELRLFLATGIMGGYTTYSSFNYETLKLASQSNWFLAGLNVAMTVVGCLVTGWLGVVTGRALAGLGGGIAG
jgi:CrcB protein